MEDLKEYILSLDSVRKGLYVRNNLSELKEKFIELDPMIESASQFLYHLEHNINEIPKCCENNMIYKPKHQKYSGCSVLCQKKIGAEKLSKLGLNRSEETKKNIKKSLAKVDFSSIRKMDYETKAMAKYPTLLEDTEFLNVIEPTLRQRVWHMENAIFEIVKCPTCKIKNAKYSEKHRVYRNCSVECLEKNYGKNKPIPEHEDIMKFGLFLDEHYEHNFRQKKWHYYKKDNDIHYCHICNTNPARFSQITRSENYEVIIDEPGYIACSDECSKIHLFRRRGESSQSTSMGEKEICDFLDIHNIKYERSNRRLLHNQEIDIYIPSHNLAIEFNGIYWHSSKFKSPSFHYNKTKKMKLLGIELIHIWEDHWYNKQHIIKSILKNKLGIINNKIYARSCKSEELKDKLEINCFLEENHILGKIPSYNKVYCLKKDNKIISLMAFQKNKDIWNLTRYCSIENTVVIGAANKLYNHFKKENPNGNVITFANLDYFNGSLYEKLGMEFVKYVRPSYVYIKKSSGKNKKLARYHKSNFRKEKLIKQYPERLHIDMTESEMSQNLGFIKLYDCGLFKYEDNRLP
jgi:hypothetical protein